MHVDEAVLPHAPSLDGTEVTDWSNTQRSGFALSVRAYAAEGYLMSACSNRKLKTLKASPAFHSEAVI